MERQPIRWEHFIFLVVGDPDPTLRSWWTPWKNEQQNRVIVCYGGLYSQVQLIWWENCVIPYCKFADSFFRFGFLNVDAPYEGTRCGFGVHRWVFTYIYSQIYSKVSTDCIKKIWFYIVWILLEDFNGFWKSSCYVEAIFSWSFHEFNNIILIYISIFAWTIQRDCCSRMKLCIHYF